MMIVDSETPLQGRLVAAGRVRLDQWFEGEIICSELEIGPDGYLHGSVAAREITVAGQIVGPVHGETVKLLAGAFVEGDIRHVSLSIEPGATLTGRSSCFKALQFPAELLSLEARGSIRHGTAHYLDRTAVTRPQGPLPLRNPHSNVVRLPVGARP